MAIEDLIGSLASVGAQRYGIDAQRYGIDVNNATQRYGYDLDRYKFDQGLPLQYGALANNQFAPMYAYGQSQGNNMAQLGGQAMGLYGNLANQQTSMYQSELPLMAEQAKFNALAPVLGGLLGSVGMGDFKIPSLSYNFQRPDVMSGYRGAVDDAYSHARQYDGWMNNNFAAQSQKMPGAPSKAPPPIPPAPPSMPAYPQAAPKPMSQHGK